MDLRDNLIKYTEYSKGDLSKKCSLEYEDIDIIGFDFSKFDLNNSFFGGSFLKECILKENVNKKSTWDNMTFENTKILPMNAFRTIM